MRKVAGIAVSALIAIAGVSAVATTAAAGGGVLTLSYPNGSMHNFGCGVGSTGSTEHDSQWPNKAANGCTTRVRLYADPGEKGSTLCLNNGAVTGTLNNTWKSYKVESEHLC